MGYTEMLLRVRAQSFVASNWPHRKHERTEAPAHLEAEANGAHSYWVRFEHGHEPQIVGLVLGDIAVDDPVFVVVFAHADGSVRRALWHYANKVGWRRLG
jgi:hypothetical protein